MTANHKRCYVLGAGFPKPFGLPLASELTQLVFDHTFPPDDVFQSDLRKYWLGFLHHLYPGLDLREDWPDFEELMTLLEEWIGYQASYEGRERNDEVLSPPHFRNMLRAHLVQVICEHAQKVSDDQLAQIGAFAQHAVGQDHALVSFNWDPLIEMACQGEKISALYQPGMPPGLLIVKPHGSVTIARSTRPDYEAHVKAINGYGTRIEYEADDGLTVRAENPADCLSSTFALFGGHS